MANKIKITATSVEEFLKIEEQISKLPKLVSEQIESAKKEFSGTHFILKTSQPAESGAVQIYLPSTLESIRHNSDNISIISEGLVFLIYDLSKRYYFTLLKKEA